MRPSDLLGSSGLFPYDKEEIPWHPGTVKRTKQKLEEGTSAGGVKRVCTQTSTADDKSDRLTAAESDAVAVETYNPVLLQHMPSPTPRRRDSSPTQEHNLKVEANRDSPSPVGSIDISLTPMRQIGRLSTSAPAPSSLSSESDLPLSLRSCRSESETSSPCVVNTPQCPSVKHHKMVLENLCSVNKSVFSKRCLSVDDSPEAECPRSTSGIVKNLKKEFEAKSTKLEKSPENTCEGENASSLPARPKRDVKIRSLPSSPVIPHNESKIQSSSSVGETKDSKQGRRCEATPPPLSSQDNAEDLSVRVLVGKYEVAKPESRKSTDVQLRTQKDKDWDAMEVHPPAKSKIAPEFSRRSAPIMINSHPSPLYSETPEAPGRPPAVPSPSVVVASVVAKAASKKQQQHGRTHPLARLQVRPRHSSPVYNTM
jgi:protein phosphatase slingshot